MSNQIFRFPWGSREDPQVLIVHFGSKSTPLIAQICRQIGLKSKTVSAADLTKIWRRLDTYPRLVILSGGDQGVNDADAPTIPDSIYQIVIRESCVLGICYGAQLLAKLGGGEVRPAEIGEYGAVMVKSRAFGNYRGGMAVMNHRDEIARLPHGWETVATTDRCANALCGRGNVWAVQFHPEMDHTENGEEILKFLALNIANCEPDYRFDPADLVAQACAWQRTLPIQPTPMLCGLSGGVDSGVAFAIARRSGASVHGMYVDNGWCREGETDEVRGHFGTDGISYVDARNYFYDAIEAIPYPSEAEGRDTEREYWYYDQVRKAMGAQFIRTFVDAARGLQPTPGALIQGTNHADIVESETGLKAHHNVGGLSDRIGIAIVEPLAGLYKFEIRELAAYLKLPLEVVHRQPFPGPGLAIRTWGKLTRDMAPPLRKANRILEEVMRKHYPDPRDRPCQYYVAIARLPTTGLMGDERVVGYVAILRMVTARRRESYATLGVFRPTVAFQEELCDRLVSEVVMEDGTRIVSVAYVITGKPPTPTEPH